MTKAKKRVGVVLSGCGYLDGSEIQEATATLLALDKRGAEVVAFAPDVAQADVVNHVQGKPGQGGRNVLEEAGRIVRGRVRPLSQASAAELDALVFPGGYGAAKNLSSWAKEGPSMKVNPEVERLVTQMHQAKKPLGFICISPVIAARVLGHGVRLTIGNDADTAKGLEAMGARHVQRAVDEIEVDQEKKVVSTPAYMYEASIAPVTAGIDKLVGAVLELA